MISPCIVRPARHRDVDAVAGAHIQADRETYQPIFLERFRPPPMEESRARWLRALANDDVFLVADDGAAIVGFAHAAGAWMSALYLIASHHRQGLGARLLTEVCAQVRRRGVAEIEFQAVAANAGAIAFYEAMGARQIGRKLEGKGEDAWEDVVFALRTDGLTGSRAP